MAITRRPHRALQPFVRMVWAAQARSGTAGGLERMLPSTRAHLVLRLDDEPVELFAPDLTGPVLRVGPGAVAGPRRSSYIRSVPVRGRTVGALLEPGATHAVLGAPGDELAGRHTALDDLVGQRAWEVHDRLAATRNLREALDLFEQMLLAQLQPGCGPHPAVVQALVRLTGRSPVSAVVRGSGYSHRQFNQHFRSATGMTPKLYSRVLRFETAVRRCGDSPGTPLAELAVGSGYSDQSHLSREFRELAGISLTRYRSLAAPGSRHVPLRHDPVGSGQHP